MTTPHTYLRPAALRAAGISRRAVERAIAAGELLRIVNGRYLPSTTPGPLVRAAREGGRLDCVSLLALAGVFVFAAPALHVQFDRGATRTGSGRAGVQRHWRRSEAGRDDLVVPIVEALVEATRCQPPRAAIATLDSAWHLGLVAESDIAEVFRRLPLRLQVLRALLDSRSESGPETFLRLLLRARGWAFDLQVRIDGVGRVDFVIEGWVIVECDSEAYHGGWAAQKRDRRRDLAAARLGYSTLRPIAEDVFHHPDIVVAAIEGLLRTRQPSGVRDVGKI